MKFANKHINEWLTNRFLDELIVNEVYLIGSILTNGFNLINDVDLVQFLKFEKIDELRSHFILTQKIQKEFKNEFGKYLHVTSFTNNEVDDYIEFMSKNKFLKIK